MPADFKPNDAPGTASLPAANTEAPSGNSDNRTQPATEPLPFSTTEGTFGNSDEQPRPAPEPVASSVVVSAPRNSSELFWQPPIRIVTGTYG